MHRYLVALCLGTVNAIDRAVFAVLEPIRKELARDLKQQVRTDRFKTSVARDIERL